MVANETGSIDERSCRVGSSDAGFLALDICFLAVSWPCRSLSLQLSANARAVAIVNTNARVQAVLRWLPCNLLSATGGNYARTSAAGLASKLFHDHAALILPRKGAASRPAAPSYLPTGRASWELRECGERDAAAFRSHSIGAAVTPDGNAPVWVPLRVINTASRTRAAVDSPHALVRVPVDIGGAGLVKRSAMRGSGLGAG